MHYFHSKKKIKGSIFGFHWILKGKDVSKKLRASQSRVEYRLGLDLQRMGQSIHHLRVASLSEDASAKHATTRPAAILSRGTRASHPPRRAQTSAWRSQTYLSPKPESRASPQPSARIRPGRVNRRYRDWRAPGSHRAHAQLLWLPPLRTEGKLPRDEPLRSSWIPAVSLRFMNREESLEHVF